MKAPREKHHTPIPSEMSEDDQDLLGLLRKPIWAAH